MSHFSPVNDRMASAPSSFPSRSYHSLLGTVKESETVSGSPVPSHPSEHTHRKDERKKALRRKRGGMRGLADKSHFCPSLTDGSDRQ